ncbi:MAG: ATPase [Candidatus Eisenbacteria sp.]|nr:ATPase [Candidatus Eisenbacteria bacterium]
MRLADFGTTWTKWYDTETKSYGVVRTSEVDFRAAVGTGHNIRSRADRMINELVALAEGGLKRIPEPDFVLVDVGSREIKYVRFENRRLKEMNWSTSCAALTGFTLELLGSYFRLDFDHIRPAKQSVPVTCGVLGMEQIFELVGSGVSEADAVARFTRGLAENALRFSGNPEHLYLSGGMTSNALFCKSFPLGVEVISLGRFVLVEGLMSGEGVIDAGCP